MNTVESVCICSKPIQSLSSKKKKKETEQLLKSTSTIIVGCKSLAANFSQHVSPLLYNTHAVMETGSDI